MSAVVVSVDPAADSLSVTVVSHSGNGVREPGPGPGIVRGTLAASRDAVAAADAA